MGRDAPVVSDGNRRGSLIWKAKIEELLTERLCRGGSETSSSISHSNPVIPLPTRLMRLAALPWFECWAGQLRTEKKSKHTIRAYTVAARDFSTTVLPGEEEVSWGEGSGNSGKGLS